MAAEWLTAIGTVGTFIVIAASAVAALMQLRHMRSGNQIAVYDECRATMDDPGFRATLDFIRMELPERLKDPSKAPQIVAGGFRDEYVGIRVVGNLFESMGLFVKNGLMDERIACELWSGIIIQTWDAMEPLIRVTRRVGGRGIWINFEYVAVLSKRYNERFPDGEYPRGVERLMPPEAGYGS